MIYLKTRENFVDIINNNEYKTGAEIGVRRGWFSHYILTNTKIEKFYLIDIWQDFEFSKQHGSLAWEKQHCIDLMKEFNDRAIVISNLSIEASKNIPDNSLDFVYLDACHVYEYIKEDINAWLPKIKKGGVLSGHDYCNNDWPGVVKAVTETVEKYNFNLNTTGVGSIYGGDGADGMKSSWWFYV